jgi:septal ring factor EnvC (AmiA/AmiB activator)
VDDKKTMIASILAFLTKLWNNRILIVSGTFVALVTLFFVYYKITEHKIDSLTRENAVLENTVKQQKLAIEQIQKDYTEVIEAKEQLSQDIQKTQIEVQELREKLFRENLGKKPLEELATKKTSLIEKKINKATQEVFKCLELLTEGGDC